MRKIILLNIITMLVASVTSLAQEVKPSWTLTSPETGKKNYVARDFINLQPGFSFTASTANTFNGQVNPRVLFPPTDNMYMDENGNIVSDSSQGATVGNLSGEFNVTSAGGASYSIPIECPPGIQGMQPQISLTYNSGSRTSIMGWGWNLGGVSMISRSTKNYYFDNDGEAIIWDKSSPLALDGERMIKVKEYGTDSIEYCTESNDVIKIVGYNIQDWGPKVFKVYYKNGNVAEYGNEDNIGSYYPLEEFNSKIKNLGWSLSKIIDPNGNFILYGYSVDTEYILSNHRRYSNHCLSEIYYGNEYNGEKFILNVIYFKYNSLDSPHTKNYISTQLLKNNKLLREISIYGSGLEWGKYKLEYIEHEDKQYLSSVKRENNKGEYLHPIKIEWNLPSYEFEVRKNYTISGEKPWDDTYAARTAILTGDIYGNGLNDIVYQYKKTMLSNTGDVMNWAILRNYGSGIFKIEQIISPSPQGRKVNNKWHYFTFYSSPVLLDYNNTGTDKLLFVYGIPELENGWGNYPNLNKNKALIIKPDERSDVYTVISKIDIPEDTYNKAYPKTGTPSKSLFMIPADFFGNGEIQYFIFSDNNQVEAFGEINIEENKNDVDLSAIRAGGSKTRIYLTDINGNGKTELMFIKDDFTYFYEYNKSKNAFEQIHSMITLTYRDEILTGDFNGDGNTDLLVKPYSQYSSIGSAEWKVYISNGNTLKNEDYVGDMLRYVSNANHVKIADVNGDGKSDIIYSHYASTNVNSETGLLIAGNDGFIKTTVRKDLTFTGPFKSEVNFMNKIDATEILTSFVGLTQYLSIKKTKAANKISKITDSFNNTLEIDYKIIKNPLQGSLYLGLPDSDSESHIGSTLNPKFEVVNTAKSKTGTTTFASHTYTFDSPKLHTKGKGFLGFSKTEIKDAIFNSITTKEQKLDERFYFLYPFKNSVKVNNQLIKEEIFSYTMTDKGNKKYFLQLDKTVTNDLLNGTSITTTYSDYDSSRNPKTIKTDYGNGVSEEKVLTYVKKGSLFYNRTSSSTVTMKAPGENDYVRKEEFQYDDKGNITEKVADKNDKNQVKTTYSEYDRFGNPKNISVYSNNQTRTSKFTYSTSGRFIKTETNHLDETVTYGYDEYKAVLSSVTNRLGITTYEYDNWRNLKFTRYPDKNEVSFIRAWASSDAPSKAKYYTYTQSSGESPIKIWYDALGREIQQETYGFNDKKVIVNTEYNTKGKLYRISNPYFEDETKTWEDTYTYDVYGRIKTHIARLGTTTYTYEPLMTTVKTPEETIITTLDDAGRVLTQETNGKKVSYAYYASGLLKTATPEDGQAVTMEYNLQGNRAKLTDPDAGVIETSYDGWGQLIQEKQQIHVSKPAIVTEYKYKSSGLLEEKNRNSEKIVYQYDAYNRISNISIAGQHTQTFGYDTFDRIIRITDNILSEKVLSSAVEYDEFGRVLKEVYPSGYYVINNYDKNGYLINITDSKNNPIWRANESNARGQLTKVTKGGKQTTYGFDRRGLLTHIATPGIIDMEYEFDDKLNLSYRQDNLSNQKETFKYDELNRLTNWSVYKGSLPMKSDKAVYDSKTGNMSEKSDYGLSMKYGESGAPLHALTSMQLVNAAQWEEMETNMPGNYYTYTDFKKLSKLENTPDGNLVNNRNRLDIIYGVDEQRRKSFFTYYTHDIPDVTKYYHDNYEEVIEGGVTRQVHYIGAPEGLAAIYIEYPKTHVGNMHYAYTDYQGSLMVLTLSSGLEKYSYTPWGARRSPSAWELPDSRKQFLVSRGYTMHEHIDQLNLINMNGRVYDPKLGMFLSTDPYIQAPENWLNFNRYSYGFNNPLKYTDPSGEFIVPVIIGAAIGAYIGGSMANDNFNPGKWDYSSRETWGFMMGGAIIGGASAFAGTAIGATGIPISNTIGLGASSLSNSIGMNFLTGGNAPISISLGAVSYDFSNKDIGYLGKKGNSFLENLSYGLGAMTNLSDLSKQGMLLLNTEKSDKINHSAILDRNEDIIISQGPSYYWIEPKNTTDHYLNMFFGGSAATNRYKVVGENMVIKNVSVASIKNYGKILDYFTGKGVVPYSFLYSSCSTHTGLALNFSGIPTLFVHPYTVQGSVWLWNKGITPGLMKNSYHLNTKY